ncbi:transcription factor 7-like 1-A [Nelusetta ayraudi]|uniref:transcription factor 7-like 1-A n=1 Tax=Nelusetta ayraudi TaxID=303726 RepID=UPI003F723AAF
MEDLKIRDSAALNAVLGKMRRSLSKEEQDGYYEKARVEKELHSQQHPGWSATFNYGRSKRMKRSGRWTPPSQCQVGLMKT